MKLSFILAALLLALAVPLHAQDTGGVWTTTVVADPSAELDLAVVAPLGKDKDLNCSRNVIPVKFARAASDEGLLLVSDLSDADPSNDFSVIQFDPADTLTVSEITNLTAVYDVVEGNCIGGSLRFQINADEGNVFVYFGAPPDFNDCSGAEGQSGIDLTSLDDDRVDATQVYSGLPYMSWEEFVALNPDLEVNEILLVADGGWSDALPDHVQSFSIDSVAVNDNTYTGDTLECDLPDATIRVTNANGVEIDVRSVQGTGDEFREDDCQYIYNLVNPGPGTYTAEILVDGTAVETAEFTVACSGNSGNAGGGNGGNGGGNDNGNAGGNSGNGGNAGGNGGDNGNAGGNGKGNGKKGGKP